LRSTDITDAHHAEIDREEHADRDQNDLGRLENAEPQDEQRHPGDRGDRAQGLQRRIDDAMRQRRIAGDRAENRSGRDAEHKSPRDAPERGEGVLRKLAGRGEIGKRVPDHRRRRHQAPVGQAHAHRDFPQHGERHRQQQSERGPQHARGSCFRRRL